MSLSGQCEEEDADSEISLGEGGNITRCRKRAGSPTPSLVSMMSEKSMGHPIHFGPGSLTEDIRVQKERAGSPTPSLVSIKSDKSMGHPIHFGPGSLTEDKRLLLMQDHFRCSVCRELMRDPVTISCGHNYCRQCITEHWDQHGHGEDYACPRCQKRSRTRPVFYPNSDLAEIIQKFQTWFSLPVEEATGKRKQGLCQQHHRALDMFCKTDQTAICKDCAIQEHRGHSMVYAEITAVPDTPAVLQHMLSNMTTLQFRDLKTRLSENYPECFESLQEDHDAQHVAGKILQSFCVEGALKITLHLLAMNPLLKFQKPVKARLKAKFECISEGISHPGVQPLLNKIYTELYITEGGSGEVSDEHEMRLIASQKQSTQEIPIRLNDIFKLSNDPGKYIKTVLTKGIAGIGKTVAVQKFIIDWVEEKANQDVHFIFPIPLRDLNMMNTESYSLMELLHRYFPELKETESIVGDDIKVMLIFDGLDECRLPLDFQKNESCHDVTEPTSVDVLLTNLIKGNLLPSAQIWMTSRPAAISLIPPNCVHRVTEMRGFNDSQKEDYFKKRFSDPNMANRVITHIKSYRNLDIMCYVPVFCWISTTVLSHILRDMGSDEIPKTQTQMYTHFLLIQTSMKNQKYHRATDRDPKKLPQSDKDMILKLGKLAFQQLEKGNLIFYEEDLKECGIDVSAASQFSTLCTEIFKEEFGIYTERVFCFVHLSIQEYLAAVYVLCSWVNDNTNVLNPHEPRSQSDKVKLSDLHKIAVAKAVKCKTGQLDLFLRFLLGLSLDCNQKLLQGLLMQTGSSSQSNEETVKFIEEKIRKESSAEKTINLFHCLYELNANSLVKEIQTCLKSGTLSDRILKQDQCSALVFVFLMSEEVLEKFNLKTYRTNQLGRQRLVPIVKTSKRAILSGCKLPAKACETVATALQTPYSPVRELDLSNNNLGDNGVRMLCAGLKSCYCRLEKLRLAECNLTEKSCTHLAVALRSCCGQGSCSKLRDLDLRDNDLKDSGVKLLSAVLGDPRCKLQILRLSGCQVTESGCASLALALSENSSHLRVLDLSYNHPGDLGVALLTSKLEKLNVDHGGELLMRPGLRKSSKDLANDVASYPDACQLTMDSDRLSKYLSLSEGNREVTLVERKQPHADHPQSFEQVLCREGLSGTRYYWEVEWSGKEACVGVAYKVVPGERRGRDSLTGMNDKSWSLECSEKEYTFSHNKSSTAIPSPSSRRVGVYLDWPGCTLSFYSVSSDTLTHLHTFDSTFTEPLYPGFGFKLTNSAVRLCNLE